MLYPRIGCQVSVLFSRPIVFFCFIHNVLYWLVLWHIILNITTYLDELILCSFYSPFMAFNEEPVSAIMGILLLHSVFMLTYSSIDKMNSFISLEM